MCVLARARVRLSVYDVCATNVRKGTQYLNAYVCVRVRMRESLCARVCDVASTLTKQRAAVYICVCVCVCVCVCARAFVCVCAHMCSESLAS